MSELVLCHVCGQLAKYRLKRLCARCYQRWQAHGDFESHARQAAVCVVVGCGLPVKAHDYCVKHWRRVQARGTPADGKWSHRGSDRCAVPACGRPHHSMGLCRTHYDRESRVGHPLWRLHDRRKVNTDRPWTPDTVQDHARLVRHTRLPPGGRENGV